MKKRCIPILALAALLAGCSAADTKTEASSVSDAESFYTEDVGEGAAAAAEDVTSADDTAATDAAEGTDNAEDAAADEAGFASSFCSPIGDSLDFTNATVYTADGAGAIELSEMTEDNWLYVALDGFVYMGEPTGVFSSDGESCPETVSHTYKKYSTGDSFGTLTLTDANTTYSYEYGEQAVAYFEGCDARFDGETTMTGVCRIITDCTEDDINNGYSEGMILFIPDGESCNLPIMGYALFDGGEDGVYSYSDSTSTYYSEYGNISLGTADDYADIDLSMLPDDGSFVNVEVTVNNVHVRNKQNLTGMFTSADIVAIAAV